MASQAECFSALLEVAERFNSHDAGKKRERIPDRIVGCTLLDLDTTYCSQLNGGYLSDITLSPRHEADIRIVCTSDDLIDMINGDLSFSQAFSTGRVRLDAAFRDLLRLRALI